MPSIYDIAQACGTSPATVSRVLNGRPGVKPETAQRIRLAMDEMKFQPRWSAADRNNILVLVPSYSGVFKSGYVSVILSGIADLAFRLKYDLSLHPFDHQQCTCRELRQLVSQKSAVGCLILSQGEAYLPPSDLQLLGQPHVVIGRKLQDDCVRQVLANSYQSGMDATEYLLALGHRRIALVSFDIKDRGHHEIHSGYMKAMHKAGLRDNTKHIQFSNDLTESGRSAALQLLSPRERPTGVVISNESLAAGFISECKNMGVSIPRDLSVIAFESATTLSLSEPALTVMQSPLYALGAEGLKLLLRQLEEKKTDGDSSKSYTTTPLPVPLIVRHSTAALHG